MTEEEARGWLTERGWLSGRGGERLEALVQLVIAENARQNLIAASTIETFWTRHIVDSAQLLPLADKAPAGGHWIDLGSGGGFPGLVIGCLREAPLTLIETRSLRARFLEHCVAQLGLTHVTVLQQKVEKAKCSEPAAVISARAFAPLDRLFALAAHLSDEKTIWVLPKGRSVQLELESAREQWQAVFHVEQSVTDDSGAILVAEAVERRRGAGSRARPARSR
jgi:16S rRNA (guanine527-N7)-methyltransferase